MTVVELQESLRSELKAPLGPIYTDATELLAETGQPLITVGDVVTDHVIEAGRTPAVALVDERTERSAVSDGIARRLSAFDGFDRIQELSNPPATLSAELLSAIRTAIDDEETTLIEVDGEEDLATLPAVLVAPQGASVVYGQPGEGMVHATVDEKRQERVRDILSRMDGDTDRLWELLGVEPTA
ncbi:DUF359 domain-containing protein [Halobacteriaceae archaeon SHR40]|uniref:GTP-dependent dephospho-CoA kinase family protein n=1 Tax=Halovenus amylolytica TaxID=2500550 RepID=UPI000FE3388F